MKILYVLSLILLLYCATTLALQDSLLLKLLAPLFRLRKIAVTVAKPLKLFQERKIAFLVAVPVVYQYANPSHLFRLLCACWNVRRESRTANQRDKLAPSHSITSSARPSRVSGIARLGGL
jgi:hypothetical protein